MYQQQLIEIDLGRIKVNPLNPRKHQGEEYARLKASIQEIGIIVPPLVRVLPASFYETIDGEGRVHAARELGLETIQVVTIGVADDEVSLTLLQASNSVRTFSLLAECRGLANLHRKGQTATKLAKEIGKREDDLFRMIAIGYFPEVILNQIEADIDRSEDRAGVWTLRLLREALPLRELLPGVTDPKVGEWRPLDHVYDYHEVSNAIGQVLDQQISTAGNMKAYVSNRRYEIYKAKFDLEVQKRVQEELELAKLKLEQVEREKMECLEKELNTRYAAQVRVLQDQYDDLDRRHKVAITDVARKPEKIAELEQHITAQVEKTKAERLRLEKDRADVVLQREKEQQLLMTMRQNLEEDARKELERRSIEQEQKYKEVEQELKAFYEQKSLETMIKAETTIRGLISHVIRLLSESQQALDHAVSPAMIQVVRDLGGAHHESFLWAIRSLAEALERAETKLTYGDREGNIINQIERGGPLNGYQAEQNEKY